MIDETLPAARRYLEGLSLPEVEGFGGALEVTALAQGEYNMNYLVCALSGESEQTVRFAPPLGSASGARIRSRAPLCGALSGESARAWVFRVNTGTQIGRDDQIVYEYRTLFALAASGVTPRPFFVDDTRERFERGVLLMEYLPGEALSYERDLVAAGELFATLHEHPVSEAGRGHLIVEEAPLAQTLDECRELLAVYQGSELAPEPQKALLAEVLAWAEGAAPAGDAAFAADPWRCVINTEVNSGNFIANREAGTLHLVDWEKALWGDPSQDLSHFAVPTTTLWKTDVRLGAAQRRTFLEAYRGALRDPHLRDTIVERVARRDPFNCLRGISWSAMAWVRYQDGTHGLRNEDTFRTVSRYLELDFLREVFAAALR